MLVIHLNTNEYYSSFAKLKKKKWCKTGESFKATISNCDWMNKFSFLFKDSPCPTQRLKIKTTILYNRMKKNIYIYLLLFFNAWLSVQFSLFFLIWN